ncbi:hypothetical protein SKAU_G00309490 [Synaphobranchus kaupii]|uniref:Uncharacterized protein n=1 Tax=Synaphobranchus kaupii TaxID=118154 RepID=A0A9Q1ERD7_SYNKA|nr:hypothetical protein SKAU_G00309490 [Synaphobranchus kaupii]
MLLSTERSITRRVCLYPSGSWSHSAKPFHYNTSPSSARRSLDRDARFTRLHYAGEGSITTPSSPLIHLPLVLRWHFRCRRKFSSCPDVSTAVVSPAVHRSSGARLKVKQQCHPLATDRTATASRVHIGEINLFGEFKTSVSDDNTPETGADKPQSRRV